MQANNLTAEFQKSVLKWMLRSQARFLNVGRLSKATTEFLEAHVDRLVAGLEAEPELFFFLKNGRFAGFVALSNHLYPRFSNQKSIEFAYDDLHRDEFLEWSKPIFKRLSEVSPRGTAIGFSPRDEKFFTALFKKEMGYHRSDILVGDVKIALRELKNIKAPATDLTHVGLELKPILSKRELPEVMKLQKRVALQNREHTYFSHTREQLESDRYSYEAILKSKQGLLLGVYRNGILKGVMVTMFLPEAAGSKVAGLSFLLDRSIQGRGVATVGYHVLLEYLLKEKRKSFLGGTSQAAVKGLGKIMKRECRYINLVRMSSVSRGRVKRKRD